MLTWYECQLITICASVLTLIKLLYTAKICMKNIFNIPVSVLQVMLSSLNKLEARGDFSMVIFLAEQNVMRIMPEEKLPVIF